ncbi:peptidoglycan DD-metalloendopeptidase family protein [Marinobacteraceae bacterium S3BR75-40.1]
MTEKAGSIVSQKFPKKHLLAACGVSAIIVLALTLSPSSEVEAQRVQVSLNLESGELEPIDVARDAQDAGEETAQSEETTVSVAEQPEDNAAPASEEAEVASKAEVQDITPAKPELDWHTYTVRSGDSLSTIFKRAGVSVATMLELIHGDGEAKSFERLYKGETVKFGVDKTGELQKIIVKRNRMKSLVGERTDDGFTAEVALKEPDVELKYATGTIDSSLYMAGQKAGLNDKVVMEMIGLFGWNIDFVYDIRKGDSFEVLYEENYIDGKKVGTGRILASTFTNKGESTTALLYTTEDGESDYYTPDGKSVRKAIRRTPINARVSSPFNLQRRHPVLGTVRPHEGTDYAAPPGTPIEASGDATISFIGWKGGYGRAVVLQHGDNISTLYAHMSGFARGLHKGDRVKQGQTIGFVGSSGMVTGPHLHYEYRINGVPRNSRTVKLPEAAPVPATEMARFKAQTQQMMAKVEKYANRYQIALSEE